MLKDPLELPPSLYASLKPKDYQFVAVFVFESLFEYFTLSL